MAPESDRKGSPDRGTIAVVERAFFVLQTVTAADAALGVREIARRVDLSPATVLRLVRTLESLGMVERQPHGSVTVGPGVHSLLPAEPPGPSTARLLPLLARMVDSFHEGATAGIDDGDSILFVAHVPAPSPVRLADATGDRWPAHTTASGIVLMGSWTPDRLDTYLAGDLAWDAPNTVTNPTELRRKIDAAKSNGYAWSVDELHADASGLAVPIVDHARRIVAAVGLYGPSYRLRPDLPHLADLPRRLANLVIRLTPALGLPEARSGDARVH